MIEKHILSLGAGVQSTTVYLLAMDGALHLDYAIFADTGDEPKAVYEHLEWLKSLNGPEILVRSRGRLSDDLLTQSRDGKQVRFVTVPFFTKKSDGEIGQGARQCSNEYKVIVVDRAIRRDVLCLKPRQRIPRSTTVHQYFGISLDEARRSAGIIKRLGDEAHFPLMERSWTRADCLRYLESRVPHEVPRSACVFCPFHSDAEWLRVRSVPEDWAEAVRVDTGLREHGRVFQRQMGAEFYAHRTCKPLSEVQFRHERQFNMFTLECEGMCGV